MIQRVLIVDDDVKLLDSFKRWMNRELQCEVHCACDLAEAQALLDCYNYVLVMTDLSLSSQRLEGFDLLDRIASAQAQANCTNRTWVEGDQIHRSTQGSGRIPGKARANT
jgi:DNA-binding NtrC family response regulator